LLFTLQNYEIARLILIVTADI
jgi:radial spoke head protein 4/6